MSFNSNASLLPPLPQFLVDGDKSIEIGQWFKQFSNLGEELYQEALKPSDFNRYIVLSVPSKEFIVSALAHGIIKKHLGNLNLHETSNRHISREDLKEGMKVSGTNGDSKVPFIALVKKVDGHIVDLSVNGLPIRQFNLNRMNNLVLLESDTRDDIGYLNLDSSKSDRYWRLSKYISNAGNTLFQKPIIGIRGTKEVIEDEWSKTFSWEDGDEENYATFEEVACPTNSDANPPFFSNLNSKQESHFEYGVNIPHQVEIWSSFNAIKSNIDNNLSRFNILLIGRNEHNTKALTGIIQDRYSQGIKYSPNLNITNFMKALELLTYGVRR